MEYAELMKFKDLLLGRRQLVTEWLDSARGSGEKEGTKVRALLQQIKEALERIECDTYGKCRVCHDDIETRTLEVRPEAEVCVDCLEEEEKESLDDDLQMAGKLQRALLPQVIPDIRGFSVAAKWLPAGEVGGDYYDFLPCGKDQLSRIVIADAMGKGVAAGIMISTLQGALRVLSADIHSPAKLVTKLNQWICRNVPVTRFVSLLCLCLEKTDGNETRLTYANAGHCPPILLRSDGTIERLDATGSVLGVHEDFVYDEGKATMSGGDFLMLYTDGITELTNARGEMFDDSRLIEFVKEQCQARFETIIDNLMGVLDDFSGTSKGLDDDLTVVTLLKQK